LADERHLERASLELATPPETCSTEIYYTHKLYFYPIAKPHLFSAGSLTRVKATADSPAFFKN